MDQAEHEVRHLKRFLGPHDPTPWIELGHAFELNHQYERALAMYDLAAEAVPKHPAGPLMGGLRTARWGETKLAVPRLEEALRRDPSDAAAWHALGLVRLHLGDTKGAKLAYQSGILANPRRVDNRIGLATLALSQNDLEEALRQYDRILEDRPKFADAYLGRSFVLMELGRPAEARDALETGYRLGANPVVVKRQRRRLEQLEVTADRSKPKAIR
jgi:tetratricopeptide (TPR) repeat protein